MQYPKALPDKQFDELSEHQEHYDLVIIGAGTSCSYTMMHYISLLLAKRSPEPPVKIAIIEKAAQFWKGIPYGEKTAYHSLIISSLNEFLPTDELESFKHWLNENRNWVFDVLENDAGILAKQWMQSHAQEMSAGLWDKLFIPRYTFGCYLKERLEKLLQEATDRGIVECSLLQADAVDVQKLNDLYQIEVLQESSTSSFLLAKKVVLAIGSPPNKKSDLTLANVAEQSDITSQDVLYINNMYQPSQNFNSDRICEVLQKSDTPGQNQVLIVGSNASALESIYTLVNSPEVGELISKFIIISPNGEFPHRVEPPSTYEPQYLKAMKNVETLTAKEILIAVQKDVDHAIANHETIGGIYAAISKGVIEALNQLSIAEQQLFVELYGVEIGKHQRRAGSDYLDVADNLIKTGRLKLIKGKFVKTIYLSSGGIGFEFADRNYQNSQNFTSPIKVVINCAGFQDLTSSSSILIQNLIRHGICTPNNSKNGFNINENLEANKNFYLIGPLIAGNMNHKFKVWHAESVVRIIQFSKVLAAILDQS